MAIKNVLFYPNEKLFVKTKPAVLSAEGKFSDEILTACQDLKDTVNAYEAEGLASTQIGSDVRAFVLLTRREPREYTVCINPEIILDRLMPSYVPEGCLSFPGVYEPITRSGDISVKYFKETGEEVIEDLKEISAIAFQHELEHLDGKVFIEKMSSTQKYLSLKKLEKVKKKISRRMKTR